MTAIQLAQLAASVLTAHPSWTAAEAVSYAHQLYSESEKLVLEEWNEKYASPKLTPEQFGMLR